MNEADTAALPAQVAELLDSGTDPVTVLTDVIASTQREVGMRWQRGEWTVAQEHAATAQAVAATKAVSAHVEAQVPVTRGALVVACAEREWHALPAMVIACAARSRGWDTTLLGASTSPMRLSRYVQDLGPEAVAVSCSVLSALPTSRRFIEAATSAGVPVVVGGPAFGFDDQRARGLGATAWAADAHGALSALDQLPAVVPPPAALPVASAAEQSALELDHRALVATMRTCWSVTVAGCTDVGEDVLHHALHSVGAALLTGDPRAVSEASDWIADVLGHRDVGTDAVAELRGVLIAQLHDYPLARALVEQHFQGVQAG